MREVRGIVCAALSVVGPLALALLVACSGVAGALRLFGSASRQREHCG